MTRGRVEPEGECIATFPTNLVWLSLDSRFDSSCDLVSYGTILYVPVLVTLLYYVVCERVRKNLKIHAWGARLELTTATVAKGG